MGFPWDATVTGFYGMGQKVSHGQAWDGTESVPWSSVCAGCFSSSVSTLETLEIVSVQFLDECNDFLFLLPHSVCA